MCKQREVHCGYARVGCVEILRAKVLSVTFLDNYSVTSSLGFQHVFNLSGFATAHGSPLQMATLELSEVCTRRTCRDCFHSLFNETRKLTRH